MRRYLAFDGGGTATRAGLYDESGDLLREASGGASNPVALGLDTCLSVLTTVGHEVIGEGGTVEAVGAALSGTWTSGMAQWLAEGLCEALAAPRVVLADDVRPILFANLGDSPGILAIAGTGSSVVAQMPDGRSDFVGGRGAMFGDDGSAFQIGQSALRAAGRALDGMGPDTALIALLPEAAGVESFHALIPWAQRATIRDIAALAQTVARAAETDVLAAECIEEQGQCMAEQVWAGYRKLALPDDAPLLLNGGVFEHCPRYVDAFRARLKELGVRPEPELAPLRGHRAALEMVSAARLPKTLQATEALREGPRKRSPTDSKRSE
jgi:N-acetylglucosamine kinase-like BadF-type ATPase